MVVVDDLIWRKLVVVAACGDAMVVLNLLPFSAMVLWRAIVSGKPHFVEIVVVI